MADDLPLRRALFAGLLLTLTTLMWAGNAVAGKLAIGEISPMLLTQMRWVLAVAILVPVNWRRLQADAAGLRAHWPFLLAMGGLGYAAFNMLLYTAPATTTVINITIIQAGMPMMIFLINLAAFSVAIGRLQVLGYVVTMIGVALVASQGDPTRLAELEMRPGDALMLLASLLYAGYTVALKRPLGLQPLSLLTAMSVGAMITSIPFALFEYASGSLIAPRSGFALAIVAYTALCASVLSQFFFMTGVSILGANRAGLFINLVPIFGTLLAVLVIGEQMAVHQGVALALVLGGILIAQRSAARG
jgi:drug/metabolite transporter (DMT)-like permease